MKKIEMKAIQTNQSLLNIITPITGIEYKQNKMRIGDNYAKIYMSLAFRRLLGSRTIFKRPAAPAKKDRGSC